MSTPLFPFGLNLSATSSRLRELADKLESGDVVVTSCTDTLRKTQADFEVKHLVIRYHERNS